MQELIIYWVEHPWLVGVCIWSVGIIILLIIQYFNSLKDSLDKIIVELKKINK